MIFKQTAKLRTNNGGEIEENLYQWEFFVRMTGSSEKNSANYNKSLKAYIENTFDTVCTYEVDLTNINLNLCPRLKKSTNFNRKLFYRYDFIQPVVNSKGQVVDILNKPELKKTWARLKARIKIDHKGDYVNKYLNRIDREFTTDNSIYPVMNQYLFFGLLFSNLPKTHSSSWSGKRLVELSPYNREKFEEVTTVSSVNDEEITYTIEGNTLSDSNTRIQRYTGYTVKGINENFARKIELNTSIIKDNIISEWEFVLSEK